MMDSEERVKALKARLAELYVKIGYSPTGGKKEETPVRKQSSADSLRQKILDSMRSKGA